MENTAKLVISKISDEFERSEFEIVVEKPPEDPKTPEKHDKNFVCQYCEKYLITKRGWQTHLAHQHGDYSQIKKLYVCDFCDHYKTISRSEFECHLETKHGPTVSLTLTAYLKV